MLQHEQGLTLLRPDWPAPANVHACCTTRLGGVSITPYGSLNLADHVGDVPRSVAANRVLLRERLHLPSEPVWLKQVHGVAVIEAGLASESGQLADASVSRESGAVCAVMTADCLPVLLCDRSGSVVAAAHAGWRGLLDGVIEQTVAAMQMANHGELLAWLGPAIGPEAFEVGDEVRAAFVAHHPAAQACFRSGRPGHWYADIFGLARQRLMVLGVNEVFGGEYCSYTDSEHYFSYRRDNITGRMASLIWLE